MPWSEAVTKQFSLVDRFTRQESDWYGPFNTLLFELFPPSEDYQVTPQYKPVEGSRDFTVHYVIRKGRVPIFFVELSLYGSLKNFYARALADEQMRDHFREISSGSFPMPKLVGVSFFGTQFCVYTFTTETRALQPKLIMPDADIVNDIAPEDRWAFDVLNDQGEAKLREVATAAKAMAANL